MLINKFYELILDLEIYKFDLFPSIIFITINKK